MIQVKEKIGRLDTINVGGRKVDPLPLEWFESGRRILHKRTEGGREVALRFLKENPSWTQGDVVYEDASGVIAIDILPCDVIALQPAGMYEMASICYEIGNKHLPLFYQEGSVLTPYEAPLFRLLTAMGFCPERRSARLLYPLRTTVKPHSDGSSESLFSKVLRLTQKPAADE